LRKKIPFSRFVCVCVCMYVCMYVCMRVCVCMYVRKYVYICVCLYMCVFVFGEQRGLSFDGHTTSNASDSRLHHRTTLIRPSNDSPLSSLHIHIHTHIHIHVHMQYASLQDAFQVAADDDAMIIESLESDIQELKATNKALLLGGVCVCMCMCMCMCICI